MRAGVLVTLVSVAVLGGALGAARGTWHATPPVDDETFVRGVALGLFATDPNWDYGPLVDEIATFRAASSPRASLIAAVSVRSLAAVDVPCALT